MNPERTTSRVGYLIVVAAAAVASACVDHVDTGIKPCPCATGYVCCESGVCAADAASCDTATSALSASVQGSWSGYIENYRPDAADTVRITISVAPDGTPAGQATFGNGVAPPPPTDPALPWPPNYKTMLGGPTFLEGAAYTARDIKWESRRLKLALNLPEPWQPWCALLPAFPTGLEDPAYTCAIGIVGEADGTCSVPGITGPTNCDKWSICLGLCQCEASGCHAADYFNVLLDIAFDGSQADGSIDLAGSRYNLRLTRDP